MPKREGEIQACIEEAPSTTHLMRVIAGQPHTATEPRSLCGQIRAWNRYPLTDSLREHLWKPESGGLCPTCVVEADRVE